MKKILIITLAHLLISSSLWAQSPDKMSYQAVIRNTSNNLVTSTAVGMQISILQGSASGTAVYVERHFPSTNANGLVSIEIGAGTIVSGNFATINWASGPYFVKTETDLTGGASYTITGTSRLLSVPYALHAKTVETITETDPVFVASPANGISNTNITNWNSAYGWGNHATAGYLSAEVDGSVTNEIELPTQTGNSGKVLSTNGTTPSWTTVADNSATNEIQSLNWSVTTGKLGISSSNAVDIDGRYLQSEIDGSVSNELNTSMTWTNATNTVGVVDASGTKSVIITGFLESEVDGSVTNEIELPTTANTGDMSYWNGTEWVVVAAGSTGQKLSNLNGVPIWIDNDANIHPTTGQIWKEVTSTTGKIWMDRNLGASQVATSSTDAASYGYLYQWGRRTDGHQIRTSGTTTTLSATNNPGHGNFITTNSSPYDWRSPQNTNLWQGVSGTNNPCPSAYRLPTLAELNAERTSWSSDNAAGAFASPLKLPMAGRRDYSNGSLYSVGSSGYYWSSTVDGTHSRNLYFYNNNTSMGIGSRAFGFSVRCIKN